MRWPTTSASTTGAWLSSAGPENPVAGTRRHYDPIVPYPEEYLRGDEKLVLDLHPHWWTITPSILALAASVVLGVVMLANDWWEPLSWSSAILILICLAWFGWRFLQLRVTHFVLTSDRVIYRHGVIGKHGVELPLESINAIHFSQRIFERMLGLGDLRIDSASVEGTSEFENVRRPNEVQNEIYVQMEANSNRKFDRVAQGIAAQAPAPTTVAPAAPSIADQVNQLAQLRDQGHLTEEEFQAKKAELLGRM